MSWMEVITMSPPLHKGDYITERKVTDMSEREKSILKTLAEKLPGMTEHQRGYLEGTIATAAAMSQGTEPQNKKPEVDKA